MFVALPHLAYDMNEISLEIRSYHEAELSGTKRKILTGLQIGWQDWWVLFGTKGADARAGQRPD